MHQNLRTNDHAGYHNAQLFHHRLLALNAGLYHVGTALLQPSPEESFVVHNLRRLDTVT